MPGAPARKRVRLARGAERRAAVARGRTSAAAAPAAAARAVFLGRDAEDVCTVFTET